MMQIIKRSILTDQRKDYIFDIFGKHANEIVGINGFTKDIASFEIKEQQKLIACVAFQIFWGQLYIQYLIVEEGHRKQGYGKKLMHHLLTYAKDQGCKLAFVETMNFQAPEFYQKLGFEVEFIRTGFDANTSFYYLRKNLR